MRALMVAAALSTMTQPGCLLGRGLEFVDGGGFPVTPPRVDDFSARDESGAVAPPGSVIRRTASDMTGIATVGLRFDVFEANPAEPIIARVYRDQPTICPRGTPCRPHIFSPIGPAMPSMLRENNTFTVRTGAIDLLLNPIPRGLCTRIDVYISSAFDDREGVSNRPIEPNDLAHVWWHVLIDDPRPGAVQATLRDCGL